MTHMLVRTHVEDFDKWREAFRHHHSKREAAGLKDLNIWRNADDPSEALILFQAPDLEKAMEFASSSDLRETMKESGVKGWPVIVFLTEESL